MEVFWKLGWVTLFYFVGKRVTLNVSQHFSLNCGALFPPVNYRFLLTL
jgi:hypothetical protein